MLYAIHITVNSDKGEWDYTLAKQTSLDDCMSRVLNIHPECTSVVFSIVPMRSLQVETEG